MWLAFVILWKFLVSLQNDILVDFTVKPLPCFSPAQYCHCLAPTKILKKVMPHFAWHSAWCNKLIRWSCEGQSPGLGPKHAQIFPRGFLSRHWLPVYIRFPVCEERSSVLVSPQVCFLKHSKHVEPVINPDLGTLVFGRTTSPDYGF